MFPNIPVYRREFTNFANVCFGCGEVHISKISLNLIFRRRNNGMCVSDRVRAGKCECLSRKRCDGILCILTHFLKQFDLFSVNMWIWTSASSSSTMVAPRCITAPATITTFKTLCNWTHRKTNYKFRIYIIIENHLIIGEHLLRNVGYRSMLRFEDSCSYFKSELQLHTYA